MANILSTDIPAIPFDPKEHSHLPISRNSERSRFGNCRQAWDWAYNENIAPRDIPLPFRFGDLVHQSFESWYKKGSKRGTRPWTTFKKLYNKADEKFGIRDKDTNEWVNAEELGIAMLKGYVEKYGTDPHWNIIAPEMTFQVVLLDKHGEPYVRIFAKLDGVARDISNGRLILLEHKTAKTIRTGHLTLDDQAGTYWTFAPVWLRHIGVMGPDEDIDFIMYNFLRKAMPDLRPEDERGRKLNKDGSVSKKQPGALFMRHPVRRNPIDREHLIDRIRKVTWEMDQVRQGKLPIYKTTSYRCPQCQYFDLCELHETGADYEEYIKLGFVDNNPYDQYEGEDFAQTS